MQIDKHFIYSVNPEDLLNIICSKKNGATKKEIELIFQKFETEINKQVWNKIFNLRKINAYILICKGKRWHSTEKEFYKMIICHVLNNDKGNRFLGMIDSIPFWVDERNELFKSIFHLSDFIDN
ncbi:MAG: hypothetical protein ACRC0V_12785 [Fusobacteriaceae bacterium]